MADKRTKSINYEGTAIIKVSFKEYDTGDLSEPNSFTVVVKKGSTILATWVAGVDTDKIVRVESEGEFQRYLIYVDTTIFEEPCVGVITTSGVFNTTPSQTIVGKARLIIT